MIIQWNGLGSFSITGKPIAGEVTLVSDPYALETGLKLSKNVSGALVTQSHDAAMANNRKEVSGTPENPDPFFISHAGEYEVQGIFVRGINAPLKDGTLHTIFRVSLEGMVVGLLGALDRPLKEAEIEALGDVDFLAVPVGGGTVLSAKEAAEAVAQVEPRVVIPTHHKIAGIKADFKPVEEFVSEVAMKREDMNKINMKKSDLPLEDTQLIVLAKA